MNPNQEAPPYTYAPEQERPRRSWQRTALIALLAGVVIAALGAPLGVLWHYLAPTVPVINAGASGFVVNDPSPEEYIAADGWFTLMGFVFGLVAAIAGWLVLRKYRGPGLLLAVTLGSLAAAPLAWWVGKQFGHSAYEAWRASAAAGATYQAPPDLHAKGALLVPAFAAVIVLTLLAGWSNDPDLDVPGAKPGYGNQLDHQDGNQPDQQDSYQPGQQYGRPDQQYGRPDQQDSYQPGQQYGRPDEQGGWPDEQGGRPDEQGGRPDQQGGRPELSSGWPGGPDPTAEQAPHAPGPAAPPRG